MDPGDKRRDDNSEPLSSPGSSRSCRAAVTRAASCSMPAAAALSRIAQARGDAVDGEMDALDDALVGVAGAVALQELELHVVEGIEVGKAVADGAGEQGIGLQQLGLPHDR